ncbi:hypothetical protein KF840_15005 [bacterium]|nr:hypothetical protein [bacterium]
MPNPAPCRPQRLAAHGPIRIDVCGCGQVHVSIGPTTVRLAQPVARALGDALRTAMARLEHAASPPLPLQ